MDVIELAKLGQKALREKQSLKTSEDVSNYFKKIRKNRTNYLRSKTLKQSDK